MNSILFICGGRLVPASRFRVDPVAFGLHARGYSTRTIYGYGALDQRLGNGRIRWGYRAFARLIRAVRTWAAHHDGPVVVQRLALPWNAWPEVSIGLRYPLIFDFDDAVFLDKSGRLSHRRQQALRKVWASSSHVVAGNSWLASFAHKYSDVTVIPTCIDTATYTPPPEPRPSVCTIKIGWIGTGFNQKYLRHLVPALLRLRRESYRFEFVVCSDMSPLEELSVLRPTFVKWSAAEEVATLRSFDIGVMPLENDDWCKGKCSFKAIQYLAVGVPVVASSVGFNVDVIDNGEQGYLVAAQGDWYEALKALVNNYDLRAAMGRAARLRACKEFDVDKAVDEYEKIITAVS